MHLTLLCCLLALLHCLCAWGAYDEPPDIRINANSHSIGIGRSVAVTARATFPDGSAAEGWQLLPYVNGSRWGSHEVTDALGQATFILPLPIPGEARIEVLARPPEDRSGEFWIWGATQNVPQTIYLQQRFSLEEPAQRATLWVAVDDRAIVFLNSKKLAEKGGWHDNKALSVPPELLRTGENVLSVEAVNGGGPAGLLLRLQVETAGEKLAVVSDASWRVFDESPAGWPGSVAPGGVAASTYGDAGSGVIVPEPWPGLDRSSLLAGSGLVEGAPASNVVTVRVRERSLIVPPKNPDEVVIAQWEPWFTPRNANWSTAQAVPLMGFYRSNLTQVARQHLIWFIESGVDALLADWSNHIWFSKSWQDIAQGSWEIINNTTLMMDEMAKMRREGHPVPKMTLLIGVSHVRPEGPTAVAEQLAFIWDTYISDPKYAGLWQELDGRPLIEVLDLGASYLKEGFKLDDRFAIRYVGVSQDVNETDKLGLWTWMDWKTPIPTMVEGQAEAMTVSIGSFGGDGWMGKEARGHRGGATLAEDFIHALRHRPRFLHLHQFNEFTGQREGQGHGPTNDHYYDSYSAELSDDFEPTSLTAAAYRCEDGWGFFYLNLVRALVDIYRQPTPETTVVVISQPTPKPPGHSTIPVLRDEHLRLKWLTVGKPATGFSVLVNDRLVAQGLKQMREKVRLRDMPDGPVRVKVIAEGTRARYRLSRTEDSLPLSRPEPASVQATFLLSRETRR